MTDQAGQRPVDDAGRFVDAPPHWSGLSSSEGKYHRDPLRDAEHMRRAWDVEPSVDIYPSQERRQPDEPPHARDREAPRRGSSREPQASYSWRATSSSGRLIGAAIVVLFAVVTLLSLSQLRVADGSGRWLWLVVSIFAVGGLAYAAHLYHGLATLRYELTPEHVEIHRLGAHYKVPYRDIQEVVYQPRAPVRVTGWEPYWPGYHVSRFRATDGVWYSWATVPPHRRVRLITPVGVIAISPERPVLFLSELARLRHAVVESPPSQPEDHAWPRFGALSSREREVRLPGAAVPTPEPRPAPAPVSSAETVEGRQPIWQTLYHDLFRHRLLGDTVASPLLAAGVAIPLLMVGYLFSQYEGIPQTFALDLDAHGNVARFGTPRDLWLLPLLAAVILALNTAAATLVIAFDRFLARAIIAAVPAVQLVAAVALLRLVN